MINPYKPPNSNQPRVFKTPIIAPLSVLMVILIYFGYSFIFFSGQDSGIFDLIKLISFELFVLCEVGIFSAIIYNKFKIDSFLNKYRMIDSKEAIEDLKKIVRTNMYSALFTLAFLGLGSLTAIMSILNLGAVKGFVVALLSIAAMVAMRWYNKSEENIKQIECSEESFEIELKSIFNCWLHKAFPNF